MKHSTPAELFALQNRIAAMKPKRSARGEGIKTVRAFTKTTGAIVQLAIDDVFVSAAEISLRTFVRPELAAEIDAEWEAAGEFEPMLLDAEFQRTMGLT